MTRWHSSSLRETWWLWPYEHFHHLSKMDICYFLGMIEKSSVLHPVFWCTNSKECASTILLKPRPSRTIVSTLLMGFLDIEVIQRLVQGSTHSASRHLLSISWREHNVPIHLHHLRNASGLEEAEFLHLHKFSLREWSATNSFLVLFSFMLMNSCFVSFGVWEVSHQCAKQFHWSFEWFPRSSFIAHLPHNNGISWIWLPLFIQANAARAPSFSRRSARCAISCLCAQKK